MQILQTVTTKPAAPYVLIEAQSKAGAKQHAARNAEHENPIFKGMKPAAVKRTNTKGVFKVVFK